MIPRVSGRFGVAGVVTLLAIIVLAFIGFRQWQGPLLVGVRVSQQPLQQQVVASGTVSSQALARIGSEVTGVLKARHVREGDRVQPGSLLLELRDDEQQARVQEAQAALAELKSSQRPQIEAALREARDAAARAADELQRREALHAREQVSTEQLAQARSAALAAEANVERLQAQHKAVAAGGVQEQQLQQRLAAAEAALAKTRIVSGVHGTVQSRAVEPGDLVQPGRTLLEIYSDDSREILVPVDERSFGRLAVGQRAQIIADAFPGKVLDASVVFLAPAVDTTRGTVDVHLALDEDADFLRQGMTVSATITTDTREAALVVGNDLLRDVRGTEARVMRVREGRAETVAVTLGLQGTVASEITAGLAAGDILLGGSVEEGARVRVELAPAVSGD